MEGSYSSPLGLELFRWENGMDSVAYGGSDHHTLSLYRWGYGNALRTDINKRGEDDSFCLMPAGAPSTWELEGDISFIHIYFDDKVLRSLAEKLSDRSADHLNLPELTYQKDKILHLLSRRLLYIPLDGTGDPMLIEEDLSEVMGTFISRLMGFSSDNMYRGGLSLRHERLVEDYIRSRLGEQILLKDLAALTGLSDFHFQRMFRKNFLMPPHRYINRLRIGQAVEKIENRDGDDLAALALDSGFSSQQHFNRVFKNHMGITPGVYKRLREERR